MQLVYAFVYWFLIAFVILTFGLAVFIFRPMRKLLQKFQTKFQNILNNQIFASMIYFSFAIIFLILADSAKTFYSMSKHFQQHEHSIAKIGLERIDIVKSEGGESMLGVLKEHREYYLAERNILLTCSALFVYFVYQRLFFNIRKLADEEHRQEHPQAQSVIPEVIKYLTETHLLQESSKKKSQ